MIRSRRAARTQIKIKNEVDSLIQKHPSLRGLKAQMLKHHNEYEKKFKKCPIGKDTTLASLKTKYARVRKTLLELFFDSEESGFCVYCGHQEARTLDHFHPKTPVPQYALVPINLFWCCDRCNTYKDESPPFSKLKLFHPARELIFKKQRVLFDVDGSIYPNSRNELIISIDVIARHSLSPKIKSRVNFVLGELQIRKRVRKSVEREIRSFRKTAKRGRPRQFSYWLQYCKDTARNSLNNENYAQYFAYRILSNKQKLQQVLA